MVSSSSNSSEVNPTHGNVSVWDREIQSVSNSEHPRNPLIHKVDTCKKRDRHDERLVSVAVVMLENLRILHTARMACCNAHLDFQPAD